MDRPPEFQIAAEAHGQVIHPPFALADGHKVDHGLARVDVAAAVFLVRDAQMPGENIHILEASPIAGGALDGAYIEGHGFCCRGGRELEDHMECLWDMFRSIPSLENPGMTILDETYYLNKDDPNFSVERAIYSGGKSATTFDLTFSPPGQPADAGPDDDPGEPAGRQAHL